MSQSTNRKTLEAVKDQTSIRPAKVTSNMMPELEVNIVKAMSHDDDPVDEKYIRRILNLTSYCHGYVHARVSALSKRLSKTHDYIVVLKSLVVIHRLLNDGDPICHEEIMYATRRGAWLLNLSDFRDEAHSSSWDHSAFVRTYAKHLDQRLELILFNRKSGGGSGPSGSANGGGSVHSEDMYGNRDDFRSPPPRGNDYDYGDYRGEYGNYGGMRRSRSYGDMSDGVAVKEGKEERRVVTSLREMKLERPLDRFLVCRPTDLAKNSRLISVALYPVVKESFQVYADICEFFDMEYHDYIKAFDAYASAAKQIDELIAFYNRCKNTGVARSSEYPGVQIISKSKPEPPKPQVTEDLVDLRDNGVTAEDQAAESGKEDWELALVETASNLSKQKAALGGGLDPLPLNGMYDQGMMAEMEKKQHLVVQEQQLWQQYAMEGMRGQATLAKIGGTGYHAPGLPVMPYGMPTVNGMGPPTGY
ncbi:hypothetical protein EUGRSUZ_C04420 [Eucalyptus grandis]|uniref:Uncharacterized protein n=2 Tax=Eucalyptus grandis TaxID=71139 RepID=A0ACC3LL17_EUCGR|nr:hypothetical protein EUGRSUZ_C04420 [Eucalyptus grandis]